MKKVSPAIWVGSLYFAESLPYQLVNCYLLLLLAALGYDNETVAFWTSLITWPWAFKALWAPSLDVVFTKKFWIVGFEFAMAAALAVAALFCGFSGMLLPICGLFMFTALFSSSHDIAADGYYIEALSSKDQAFYCGWRNTFYRLGTIGVNGGLLAAVGFFVVRSENYGIGRIAAWQGGLLLAAVILAAVAVWHLVFLPGQKHIERKSGIFLELGEAFWAFFRKKGVCRAIVFILLFRFAEALLGKIAPLFLTAERSVGGIGLQTEEFGLLYGTIGVVCLIAGGILAGVYVSRKGLSKSFWPMALALNIPDAGYLILAVLQPVGRVFTGGIIAVEQLGYGFGMTALMLYMASYVEDSGKYKSSHFAFLTGFMALGMMLPGMVAGYLQNMLGYTLFFVVVLAATVPAMSVIWLVKGTYRDDFGRA